MTIEQQITSILSIVTAQTAAISELAKAVANSGTSDNSAVLSSIAALDAKVTDVQSQLEEPTPAPAPAPEPVPAPAA